MKVGLMQISPSWEKPEESVSKVEMLLEKCKDADLLIFPEMTLTGFSMNAKDLAEDIDGISTSYFINLSREIKTHIIAGIIESDDDKIYNSAVHFNRDGLIAARYRKIHPFSMGNEEKHYNSSRQTVATV